MTETIDKLFLELSQFTKATTAKEIQLQQQLAAAHADSLRLRGALQMIEHATAPTHDDDAFHENAYTLA